MTANHIGTTVWVSETIPATNTLAGFEAITNWVQISGVQSGFQLGFDHANIDIDDLQSGRTRGVKGMGAGTQSTSAFRGVDDGASPPVRDPGQVLAKALAEDAQGTCSIKQVTRGSGTDNMPAEGDPTAYAQGYLSSYLPNQPSGTSSEGFSVNFRLNDLSVEGTHPAVV